MKKKNKTLSPDIEDLLADYLGQDATPSKPSRQTSKSDKEPAKVAVTPVSEFDPEPSPEPEPMHVPDPGPTQDFKLELEPMLRPGPEPEPMHATDPGPPQDFKLELEPMLKPRPELEPMHATDPGPPQDFKLELEPMLRPGPEPEPMHATDPGPPQEFELELEPMLKPRPEPELEPKPDHAIENKVPHAPVKELFMLIEKAVKTLNLYEGKGDICEKAVDLAFSHLSDLSSQYGNIYINVTPYEFLLGEQSVYTTQEEQSGITYRLFRDGLRELEFKPCIERRELADFLDILRSSPSSNEEADSITLLWEKELPGISYQAVDLFFEGALSAESNEFQVQVEKLMAQLKASTPHSEMSSAAQNLKARITPEAIKHARSHLSQVMATLPDQDGQTEDLTSLESQVPDCSDDISRRTLGITLQLLEIGGSPIISSLFLQSIEKILLEGNWDRLVSPCQSAEKSCKRPKLAKPNNKPAKAYRLLSPSCAKMISCSPCNLGSLPVPSRNSASL